MPDMTPQGRYLGATNLPLKDHPLITCYAPKLAEIVALPSAVSLLPLMPPVFDQGQQGSCTANAHVALFMAIQKKAGQKVFVGSRAFNYYLARKREGTTAQDAGASPQDNLASLVDEGLCSDSDMAYSPTSCALAPNTKDLFDAKHHRLTGAKMVAQDILHLKSVLAAGFPFTFGILIYPSFENATDGLIPLPRAPEQCLGGHDLISYGFKDDPSWAGGGYFQGQNSWGSNWGIAGRFQIPYAYLTNASLAFQMTTGTGVKV